jgi:exosortase/archaeosortase family protein
VPTGTSGPQPRLPDANKYVVWAATTGLGMFALLRLPWVEASLVLPLTRMQGAVAASAFNTPAAPISVTLACSGTEVIAMCLGAVLAYPASWAARLSGAAAIVAGILALNTLRIGTLGLAADDAQWFNALHLYLWPAGLVVATAGGVFAWMRHADRASAQAWSPSWKFVALALVLLTVSALTAPAYINSAAVYGFGSLIAHAGAMALSIVAEASATGNVLWTTRGGFSVTGDCVATPLLPLYVAAVWVYAPTWSGRIIGSVMAVPIFFLLGVARLLLVALPQSIAPTPEFASHTFYQFVLAVVLVALAGRWRRGARAAVVPVAAAVACGVLFVLVAGEGYASVVLLPVERPLLDPQGALALWPPFQIALFLALWIAVGWGRSPAPLAIGLLVLLASHVAGAWSLTLPGVPAFFAEHVSAVRAWAVAAPVLLGLTLLVARDPEGISAKSVPKRTVSPVGGS